MYDVGANGSISHSIVINNNKFYEKLTNNRLMITPYDNPKGNTFTLLYVFVGDEAFALR